MDRYKVIWTRLQTEIFRFLCIHAGEKFNLRETARKLKVSPTAVGNALPGLEEDGIIRVEKSKTMNLFTIEFNRDNQRAIDLKRVENLRMIYVSGLVVFLEDTFPGCAIILFGSYSRGEDIVKSDVDIAIVGSKGKKVDLERYEKVLGRVVTINSYKSWDINNNLRNNILNGIVLGGSVDL